MSDLIPGDRFNLIGTSKAPIDPLITPLRDNGGKTLTQALRRGSPAIDKGQGTQFYWPVDQRGLPRVVNGKIDIGATEYQVNTALDQAFGSNDPWLDGEYANASLLSLLDQDGPAKHGRNR